MKRESSHVEHGATGITRYLLGKVLRTNGEASQAVLHDYAEGVAWFGVSELPTVLFNEKGSLVGAGPEEGGLGTG